ncbi:hypothetical protein N7456_003414 [Penicillium angulare]|uniref:Uncharacterized protein n=1 Tax=Penicillium angulare TaxID=116970 RepID=A0A9W9KHH7_9EURO|nr:hypothetical protein N7456_003414 [Penicillium angulare]
MSLSSLPTELTQLIASFIRKDADLNSLVLVNLTHYHRLNHILYEHTNIDFVDPNHHRTLLSWAAYHGQEDRVKCLIESGKFDVNHEDDMEQTPLHLAALQGHSGVVALLLQSRDIDIQPRDQLNQTPLLLAAGANHESIVTMLLEAGDAGVNADDCESGYTALMWAVTNDNKIMLKQLLEVKNIDLSITDIYGRTALDIAVDGGRKTEANMIRRAARRQRAQARGN